MAQTVIIRLRALVAQKEAKENRRITYNEIRDATGLAESTIADWMKNRATRFDADTIKALCDYLECTPGDLLDYTPLVESHRLSHAVVATA